MNKNSRNDVDMMLVIKIAGGVLLLAVGATIMYALKNPLNTTTKAGYRQNFQNMNIKDIQATLKITPRGAILQKNMDNKEKKEKPDPTEPPARDTKEPDWTPQ